MPYSTPVLLIIYNRSDVLSLLFDTLRVIQPNSLFIACDGPKDSHSVSEVYKARTIALSSIDWECDVHTRFLDHNLGCRLAVSSAITWFFQYVDEGIILEDDCIPDLTFFPFIQHLLEFYRDDHRVFSICGSNFFRGKSFGQQSLIFSRHADSWGWATWQRAWSKYSDSQYLWVNFATSPYFKNYFPNPFERFYWLHVLNDLFYRKKTNSWLYQWMLTSWINRGIHIYPTTNLISNIGYGSFATHTKHSRDRLSQIPLKPFTFPIVFPQFVFPNDSADNNLFFWRRKGLSSLIKTLLKSTFLLFLLTLYV